MQTFKDYLIEAQFDGDSMERVINAFQRRMPRLLGSKIYRYGGSDGADQHGAVFFFGTRAFRVRTKGNRILGIDVWDRYALNKGPSFFIDISDFGAESIIGSMKKLAQIIKNPEAGKVAVKESQEIQLDEMARRATPQDFHEMGVEMYGDDQVSNLTWSDIQKIAAKNDVLIPGYVKSQQKDKLHWSIIPNDRDSSNDQSKGEEMANDDNVVKLGGEKKGEPILYIKITAQDPDTKRFISAADSKTAQKMYARINTALKAGPTEEEIKDPATMYGHMAQLVDMACKNKLRSLLIYGGPGTGKTFTIMQTVKENGLIPGKDYVKLSGKATPISIFETLFQFRDGGLVIFDDLDSMWRNEEATNILKAALDTSPVREITWSSAATENVARWNDERRERYNQKIDALLNHEEPEEDDELDNDEDEDDEDQAPRKKKKKGKPEKVKYPSTFNFKGRVIFISNLKKEEFDSAIMSRSAKIGMDMTPAQILQRMRAILPNLGGTDVAVELKEELIQRLLELNEEGELDQVTMREFTKGLDILRSGAPNWRELVIYA
ncbi:ATP-binding protein [Acinetobacter sp.]|uniref:ATP-binding protein n=1 Tax=Acinetobacter sp. TaxID=472 RepID=UPI0038902C58